jgi:AbrB family looped-hinge helix DNA binding protein
LNVLTSKLSVKGQVTIPKEVRDRLGVKAGDLVSYEVRDGVATVRRVEPFDAEFHAALFQTLGEWATPADDEAFSDL